MCIHRGDSWWCSPPCIHKGTVVTRLHCDYIANTARYIRVTTTNNHHMLTSPRLKFSTQIIFGLNSPFKFTSLVLLRTFLTSLVWEPKAIPLQKKIIIIAVNVIHDHHVCFVFTGPHRESSFWWIPFARIKGAALWVHSCRKIDNDAFFTVKQSPAHSRLSCFFALPCLISWIIASERMLRTGRGGSLAVECICFTPVSRR